MTIHEELPVVELEELLDDQESPETVRTGRQITLILVLTIVGLACVAVLAAMLVPVVADVVVVVDAFVRLVQFGLGS